MKGTFLLAPKPMNIVAFRTPCLVHLEPEDITRLIPMRRLEVLEHSTLRQTVTILKFESFEGCIRRFTCSDDYGNQTGPTDSTSDKYT
ncbi:hypothetical protein F2Q69_00030988 [Brassica cretica]|uniref:Uncharacterized protein n=1 Tax=Brassica cretica TaxID=69181 RepID=A0A8S9RWK7_BRACR|nr:hypothetical protein F2Q69_00030988 [Brassica cretica]